MRELEFTVSKGTNLQIFDLNKASEFMIMDTINTSAIKFRYPARFTSSKLTIETQE